MIPNLNELPPLLEAEERSWKKLLRPLLGLLFMLGVTGGVIWLYTRGVEAVGNQEMNLSGGLQGIANDLWRTGAAREIRVLPPDLPGEIARLRIATGPVPKIVVLPVENLPGRPRGTHELLYLNGQRQILSVQLWVDEAEGKIDILSYQTGAEFKEKTIR